MKHDVTQLFKILMLVAGLGTSGAAMAETAHEEGDPWCDDLVPGDAGAVDCALVVGETVLFFDYEGDSFSAVMTLSQTSTDGAPLDTSDPIAIEGVVTAPALRDINSDGSQELFIPTLSGMVNTDFFVWQSDEEGIYYPSGTIQSIGVDALEVDENLVVTATRDSAAAFIETAYILDIDGFILIYMLYVDYAAQECSIIDNNGILAAGFDEDAIVADCESRDWQ